MTNRCKVQVGMLMLYKKMTFTSAQKNTRIYLQKLNNFFLVLQHTTQYFS